MSDDVFRWIITIGVAASWVTTIVMAVAILWIYRSSKRMEEKLGLLVEKVGPVLDSALSMVDDARPKIHERLFSCRDHHVGPGTRWRAWMPW